MISRSLVNAAHSLGNWLYDWQTLVTGLLALAIGAATIMMIKRQIHQQDEHHSSGRRSRFVVAKAKSPFAAIELANHARSYLVAVERLFPLVLMHSQEPFEFDGPDFPSRAEEILDSLVETSEDSILIDQISALYSEHQVISSRISCVRNPSQHGLTIYDYVLQPLMMDAIAMNLLAFGRDGSPMTRLNWVDIRRSAKRIIADPTIRVQIDEYIKDKIARARPVPLALRRHAHD